MMLPKSSFLTGCGLMMILACAAQSAERAKLVTYAKTHRPDHAALWAQKSQAGTPETFMISEGEFMLSGIEDAALRRVPFHHIASAFSDALESRGLKAAEQSRNADVIIVVHRGRTRPNAGIQRATSVGAQSNRVRQTNAVINSGSNLNEVARLLGFQDELERASHTRDNRALSYQLRDVIEELKQERYFLVIAAYDMRANRAGSPNALLWETRLSFTADGHAFADRYAAMISAGADYFGQDTAGKLQREFVTIPSPSDPEARFDRSRSVASNL